MNRDEWESGMALLANALDDEHPFGTATVHIGELELNVLVAESAETRARGMSGRGWGEAEGMLFVQPKVATAEFHMRDVGVDIALLCYDDDGYLVAYRTMLAGDEATRRRYPIDKPFRYALELPVEWAVANKVWESADVLLVDQIKPGGLKTKAEANYRDGDGATSCSTCANFQPPSNCSKVTGSIEPSGLSDLYEARPATV